MGEWDLYARAEAAVNLRSRGFDGKFRQWPAGPTVALTATIHHFDIDLADHDRGVFESLALRVAKHPSESEEYLWTRVLAYALEYQEGIEFSKGGISDPDDPAIMVRDLTGAWRTWIEIGTPDAARLHKAAKAAPRVVVYIHKDPAQWLSRLAAAGIPRADRIEIFAIDRTLIARLVPHLERRVTLSLTMSDRELYVSIGSESIVGTLPRLDL
jgi:uncharacterized protein YaeQ